ncbi:MULTISPECIES: DUF932 domain-containing protein [unclassified Rubrivivax]|uniref:DUF932 domain-containing protein n=1 Tax=unclassified Rubrivivax TaxID=2649762 RepID=UPI001E2F4B17|nr:MULTISPECIES: DUF932 domain-containing protein [unclassified Rubrivivax]MCC9598312.1 DUF945 domain-containing protein [Rubrivivax sp. JA1055]MCC9645432.1 DUF945 domain-containing protein [Rubrivivax sp. JA1029]
MQAIHPTLATRFGHRTHVLRSHEPLAEDQIRAVAPSVFAEGKHASRSERYTYIPTIEVLRGLKREGFEPYMAAQGHSRLEDRRAFTKHMLRLRHAGQVQATETRARDTVNEIILINSHDGGSSYQMLAGLFRFVCCNGLVVGDVVEDIRIPHKGDVRGEVIEGAFRVLEEFDEVDEHAEAMKALPLEHGEEIAFATAALALRFGERALEEGGHVPAPVTAEQLVEARRPEDLGHSLWTTFQRVQENVMQGGQAGRSPRGRRISTRPVGSIDRAVSLNRALWMLAEEMRKLKA